MNSLALLNELLGLTLIASIALVLILTLRPLLRRTGGPVLAYAAWLLLPLSLIASTLPHAPLQMAVFNVALPDATLVQAAALQSGEPLWRAADAWLLLWLIGTGISLGLMVRLQWRFERSLGLLLPTGEHRVFRADQASSSRHGPLLIGLLRPRIVLPCHFESRYSADEQRLIRAHEHMHLQRGDLLANACAALLQAVFWFNPLVHLAAGRFRLDQELACDELVLRQHPRSRKVYASAILKTQLGAQGLPLACQWHSRHPVHARIVQLSQDQPKRSRRLAAAATLSGLMLAASYGAWAVDTGPGGTGPSAGPDLSGKARFKLAVSISKETGDQAGAKKTTITADLPIEQGKRIVLFPGQSGTLGCAFNFEVQDVRPDGTVMLALPLNCTDVGASDPRLLVHSGEPAKMQIGRRDPGGALYTLIAVVTPWPADVARPGSAVR